MGKVITNTDKCYDKVADQHVILVLDDNEEILDFLAEDLGEKYCVLTARMQKKRLIFYTSKL